jgi:hypothetical protein
VTGDTDQLAVAVPVMVAVGAALWGVFWRPAVVAGDGGVELLNVVRDVRVPWPLLDELDTRYALTLHVGERRYRSWAAGAPGRPMAPGRHEPARDHKAVDDDDPVRSSRSLRADSGAAAFMVERRWERARATRATGGEQVTTRWVWHWPLVSAVASAAAWLASSAG